MPLIQSLWDKVTAWLGRSVQDVPPEIAACEFDCSRPHCFGDELEECERRIREATAGGASDPAGVEAVHAAGKHPLGTP